MIRVRSPTPAPGAAPGRASRPHRAFKSRAGGRFRTSKIKGMDDFRETGAGTCRTFPGNLNPAAARAGDDRADDGTDDGPAPPPPKPNAETAAHRSITGIILPVAATRLLAVLPVIVRDAAHGNRAALPIAAAHITLAALPAAASRLAGPAAFRKVMRFTVRAAWPLTGASIAAAFRGAPSALEVSHLSSGYLSVLSVVADSRRRAFANSVALSTVIGVAYYLKSGRRGIPVLAPLLLAPIAVTPTFMHLATVVLGQGREHDAVARRTAVSSVAATRLAAANAEATRFNALLHDQVLAVLKAVKAGAPPERVHGPTSVALLLTEREPSTATAKSTTPKPASRSGTTHPGHDRREANGHATGPELAHRLRAIVGAESPDCAVTAKVGDVEVPRAVASALAGALEQVARNSALHAGHAANRTCDIRIGPDGIDVRFADDGRGFDPAAVPEDRIGLRTSILDRLHSLDGASARVDSVPGQGTVAELQWTPDPVAAAQFGAADTAIREKGISLLTAGVITALALLDPSTRRKPRASLSGWGLLMAAQHLQRTGPAGPPSPARTASVIALALAGTLAPAAAGVRGPVPGVSSWNEVSFAMTLALVAARGRPVPAFGGALAWCAGAVARRWSTGCADDARSAAQVPVIVFAGVMARSAVEGVVRRVEAARAAERRLFDSIGRRHAEQRTREANRGWLDDVAGGFLRRIRDRSGGAFDDEERRHAGLLDARIRDALRSPRLDRPDISRAAWDLRARGVAVLLVDDRGDGPDPAGHLDAVAEAFTAMAPGITAGRVTVRVLPHGRADYATIVTADGGGAPRRIRIPAGDRLAP